METVHAGQCEFNVRLPDGRRVVVRLARSLGELFYKGAVVEGGAPPLPEGRAAARAAIAAAIFERAGVYDDPAALEQALYACHERGLGADFAAAIGLRRVVMRLRAARGDLRSLPEDELVELIRLAIRHARAEQAAAEFFAFGTPQGLPRHAPSLESLEADLRAAELMKGAGASGAEAAQLLGLEPQRRRKSTATEPQGLLRKRAHDAARRGWDFLVQILGEEGAEEHCRTAGPEVLRWLALPAGERALHEEFDRLGAEGFFAGAEERRVWARRAREELGGSASAELIARHAGTLFIARLHEVADGALRRDDLLFGDALLVEADWPTR